MEYITEKDFIREIEDLGLTVEEGEDWDDDAFYIKDDEGHYVAMVRRDSSYQFSTSYNYFEHLLSRFQHQLLKLLIKLASTPVGMRKEKEKHIYKFLIPTASSAFGTEYHICRNHDEIILDSSSKNHVLESEEFHFTDEEVKEYSVNDNCKHLFKLCRRIKVEQ